ncbi:hypothetical protein C8N40_104395 [Pontibacter mucosus]|uniref:Uncharacterized protein n=1 Tax=Pontibacter mucosus TaxID=1649266 RepID=A0A2T5YK29_9BACT|nr:hypothetical protein C8N40_104395 [Pontibacter mucosus]
MLIYTFITRSKLWAKYWHKYTLPSLRTSLFFPTFAP